MASLINEQQVALRTGATNFPTLKSYMDSYVVRSGPLSNQLAFTLGAAASFTSLGTANLNATILAVGIAPISTAANGGLTVAPATGALGVSSLTTIVDGLGNILNMVSLLDGATNDPYVDPATGATVFGLMHVANTTTDGTAVGAANVQMDFVTLSSAAAITSFSLPAGNYKFRENRTYSRRQEPTIFLEGGNTDWENIYSPATTVKLSQFEVTAAYASAETITLSTGAGAITGVSTVVTKNGGVTSLDASLAAFNADSSITVLLNGAEQINGVDVIWISPTEFSFVLPLYVGDYFVVKKLGN
jgi:hypothetical protein